MYLKHFKEELYAEKVWIINCIKSSSSGIIHYVSVHIFEKKIQNHYHEEHGSLFICRRYLTSSATDTTFVMALN